MGSKKHFSVQRRIIDRRLTIMRLMHQHPETLRGVIVASDGGNVNNCILTSAVMSRVFADLGIAVRLMPARVMAYNASAARWLHESPSGSKPPEDAKIAVIGADEEIGQSTGTIERFGTITDTHWNGHLACVATVHTPDPRNLDDVLDRHWLVDLSLDQAHRPDLALHLAPHVSEVTEQMRWPGAETIVLKSEAGILLTYKPYWKVDTFKDSPYWQDVDRIEHIAARTMKMMRTLIEMDRRNDRENDIDP